MKSEIETFGFFETVRMKSCSRCFDVKPATTEYFSPRRKLKDGLYGQCKVCRAELERLRYHAKKHMQTQSPIKKFINLIKRKVCRKIKNIL